MKVTRMWIVASIAAALAISASAQRTPEVALRAAMETETVKGDLKGAIEQYKKVAQSGNRALAAQALVHMAECYQKLGDSEAQKIYERVVREFGDQKDAASAARAHLGRNEANATSAGMTSRRVWGPSPAMSWNFLDAAGATISGDGRLASYNDYTTGNLAVHDFSTGQDRYLTTWKRPEQRDQRTPYPQQSAVSRDGKLVAYTWFNPQKGYELRVTSLEGSGMPQSRLLLYNDDILLLKPNDWSPDGNWIAVQLQRKGGTQQMGLVSARDGSLRVLKSADWQSANRIFFSPDGKYLGFDAPVRQSSNDQRDVFILAVDGSREVPAVTGPSDDTMMGWSPDGKHLLFASDRGGTLSLWGISVTDGRPQGSPVLLKSGISRGSLGVSNSGSLYSGIQFSDRDIQVATVDFKTGKLVSGPINPAKSFLGVNEYPEWSPDGKYLSYLSFHNRIDCSCTYGIPVLAIWSPETGETREIQPKLSYFGVPGYNWAPDGRSFIVNGRDLKNRPGVYRLDAQTGDATPLMMHEPGLAIDLPQLSPDGKRLYYRRNFSGIGSAQLRLGSADSAFVERDLASGTEREIIRRPNGFPADLSPDGRFIATTSNDESTKSLTLVLIPVSGGEPRELLRLSQPERLLGPASWTPDGNSIIVEKVRNDSLTDREFLLVPVDGGQPRKIDVGPTIGLGPVQTVHPDGKQIAYVVGDSTVKQEVWVLENFLPALNAKK